MLTGSMAPLINPGDVVVSVAKPASELKTGDVITYGIPVEDRRIETHRVVDIIRNADGTTAVRTKGDANNGADPWTAIAPGGHRRTSTPPPSPTLGTAIRTLRGPYRARRSLMYGAPAVLVVMLLISIWEQETGGQRTPHRQADAGHEHGTPLEPC